MSGTGTKKVDIFLKKLLPQQQVTANFFDLVEELARAVFGIAYPNNGIFSPGPLANTIISSSAIDVFTITTPLTGTDGPTGHILIPDPADFTSVPFENTVAIPYFTGARFNRIPVETEINVKTGVIKYTFLEESIGELAEPDAVVDDGDETLTVTIDSVCEAGVTHAGRKARIWLKTAVNEAQAFEEVTVIFSGGANKIETTTALGQTIGSISTDPADYQVFLIGPTVRRGTDLRLDNNILFTGIVTGVGLGSMPVVFDQTDVLDLSFDIGALGGLFDIEHDVATGIHTDINPDTITTKQTVTGIQLDTQVNASDEDSPDVPVAHSFFSSSGGTGIQAVKWRVRDSVGNVIAFIDAHGNAYFQSLASVAQTISSTLVVEGNTTLGDDIAFDITLFNSQIHSNTDLLFLLDANNDGTGHFAKFFNNSVLDANRIFQINESGLVEFFGNIQTDNSAFTIDLDNDNDDTGETFSITKHNAGVLLWFINEFGDASASRDTLGEAATAYALQADGTVITGVDASLNEVYDQGIWRDILRITPNNPADKAINISGARITLASGEEFGIINQEVISSYAGSTVNFATGVNSVGSNFTPFTPSGVSRFFKYGLALDSSNQIVVISPTLDFATQAAARAETTEPNFTTLTPVGTVIIEDDGAGGSGTIEDVDDDDYIRFKPTASEGGGGGGATGLSIELAEQHCELKHTNNNRPDEFDNGICVAFNDPKIPAEGFLLRNYVAAQTQLEMAINPLFLDPTNKNGDFDNTYSIIGNAAVIDSITGIIGTGPTATSWNKTLGSTTAGIQKVLTNAISLASFRTWLVQFRTPDAVGDIVSLDVVFSAQSVPTIFKTISITTDINGTALSALSVDTFHLLKIDVNLAGTDTGGGWEPETDLLKTIRWNVITGDPATTLTNMAITGPVGVPDNGQGARKLYQIQGPQKGDELTLSNDVTRNVFNIDSTSPDTIGPVIITAMGNSYAGGDETPVLRSTLDIIGDNKAVFATASPIAGSDLASGAVENLQEVRFKKILTTTIAGGNYGFSVSWDTPLFWEVINIPDGTHVDLTDPADYTAELPSGTAFHVFNVFENNGRPNNVDTKTDIVSDDAPAHNSGVTTIAVPSSGAISIGQKFVKRDQVKGYFSSVSGEDTNENFGSALVPTAIIFENTGIPLSAISGNKLFAEYLMGGDTSAEAFNNNQPGSPGNNLTINGAIPSISREFIGTRPSLASGEFSNVNYLSIAAGTNSDLMDAASGKADAISISIWVKRVSAPSTTHHIISRSTSVFVNGFTLTATNSNRYLFSVDNTSLDLGPATLDQWTHIGFAINGISGDFSGWQDGIRTDGNNVITATNTAFFIGRHASGGATGFTNGYIGHILAYTGHIFTDQEIEVIRNKSQHRPVGTGGNIKNRFEVTGASGNKISGKVEIIRTTNDVSPLATKAPILKTN